MKYLEINDFPALEYTCAEEMNTLCTNLTFFGATMKKIMVTSCQASEGKSFLSMNMARSLASLGKRVVLVDADLRRSMIQAKYGVRFSDARKFGLTHYLGSLCEMEEAVYATNIEGVYMVPVGRCVSNSLPLLNTARFSVLLERLTTIADFVLLDAPPVGLLIDAAEIAKSCDGILLAVQYNKISRGQLIEAKQRLERTGCTILGTVLNNVTMDSFSSRKYYYKSYYSHYNQEYNTPAVETQKPARKTKRPKQEVPPKAQKT